MLKKKTSTLAFLALAFLAGSLMQGQAMSAKPARPSATWSLVERFGVSHPEQIVYLDLPKSVTPATLATSVLTDSASNAVPFQLMGNGQLAIRTDLPAGASLRFSLQPGLPAPCPAPVLLTETENYIELTNGLVGLRVPVPTTNFTQTPAPIQGLRFQDGVWTALGPNTMDRPAKAMTVEWLEKGPLVARVKVAYTYDKGLLHSARPEWPDVPAGDGPYSVTIELQAGQPSILFEEESEVDIGYRVNITEGLTPTRAQYRGHHANSPEAGHEEDGRIYKYETFQNQRHDALVDLDYDRLPKDKDRWSGTTYPFMSHWDPWGVNTGFYWELYTTAPGGSDNLLGIFAGRASRLMAPGLSGVSFDTQATNGVKTASLQLRFQRLMPTQYYSTHMRFGWGLFLGKKSADLKPTREVQAVNRQMNLHGGVNLNALYRLPADFPNPPAGYGNLYVKSEVWKRIADQLQAEAARGESALYHKLYNGDPYFQGILDFWRNPTPEVAAQAAASTLAWGNMFLDTLVNGQGIYRHETHYFMGCLSISAALPWFDQLLGSDAVSAADKQSLKQTAALYGTLLWNNDLSPMQPDCGMNWGPANMSSMWLGTRYAYTAFLSRHPMLMPRVEEVRQDTLRQFHAYVNEAGACNASAHYTGAAMCPILNLIQQLQMSKVADLCATDPLLSRYAEWEMQLMTPPDLRFGGLRKIIAVGDGSTEFSARPGQLGTAFALSNPALSARLMGAHQAMGSPPSSFFGSSYLKIDPALPTDSPRLTSADFPGWMSVLRSGWETPDETAVFFINGTTLSDHRHNDNGTLVIYALGAPLSLDWGPIYYPRVAGGLMHSIVLPETTLDRAWSADNTSLDLPGGTTWGKTDRTPFLSFAESDSADATFHLHNRTNALWRRTVRLIHPEPTTPIILVDDSFTGSDKPDEAMISTLNLMAQGSVMTPAGAIIPVERLYDRQDKTNQALPSAGQPQALPQGLSRLQFTGQYLIDWDLVADCAAPTEMAIGNWANNWNQSVEVGQFQRAMGRPYEERQDILRLRTGAPTRLILLPYRKGARPANLAVTKLGADTVIKSGPLTLTLTAHGFSCENGDRKNLTSFDTEPMAAFGIKLQGGPAEAILSATNGTLTIIGDGNPRAIELPEGWSLQAPARSRAVIEPHGRTYRVTVPGMEPVELSMERK